MGEKQAARLLAAIRDPYWNDLHDRPRTVSELWAYAGYHTLPVSGHAGRDSHTGIAADRGQLPVGQSLSDTHKRDADGSKTGHVDQSGCDAPSTSVHVAAKRAKGQRANWSSDAKMRAYLISESVVKAGGPWREVYDKRKAATEGRTHAAPCVRCGPSGKPALPGSEWSKGHRHADALRITSKEILKGMWTEARRLHNS